MSRTVQDVEMTIDRETLVAAFARGDAWFETSPLYQVLARAVVADEALLDLAAEARPGQQPANMLMAAAHGDRGPQVRTGRRPADAAHAMARRRPAAGS